MKFIIVTGLSGSGKSEAMRALEDMGFYCVDNLPPTLIPKFAELCYQSNSTIDKVALGIDVRGRKFFEALHESLNTLRRDKYPFEVLYLDCADDVLLKRYKNGVCLNICSNIEIIHWQLTDKYQKELSLKERY